MLDGQYGPRGAELIRTSGLLENPIRLGINHCLDEKVDGEPQLTVPEAPQPCFMCRHWQSYATSVDASYFGMYLSST